MPSKKKTTTKIEVKLLPFGYEEAYTFKVKTIRAINLAIMTNNDAKKCSVVFDSNTSQYDTANSSYSKCYAKIKALLNKISTAKEVDVIKEILRQIVDIKIEENE